MTTPSPGPTAPARVLLPSLRRVNPHAAWCSNFEFEDVIRRVDDVELLPLAAGPAHQTRQHLSRSLAWRRLARLNPGIRPVTLGRDYDLFVFVAMNVWDLLYLEAIRDWRERCRVKICYMVEFYAAQAPQFGHMLRPLADFDHVVQTFSGSVEVVGKVVGKPCHHVPLATDVLRFTPYPGPPARVIDVLSVGRRSEPVHARLLGEAASRRIFYVHDTIPGALVRPSRPDEHRDMLANLAKRSRFFVAYPAKHGDDENQGQSDVGARFFEGAAAGAVLLGQAPSAPGFREAFPWPDPVVEARADGSDVVEVLARHLAAPAELERMSARNAAAALRGYDWSHRWQSLLRIAGVPPRPALGERLRTMAALADLAAPGGTA